MSTEVSEATIPADTLRAYLSLRERKDYLNGMLKDANTQLEILESQITEQLGAQGLDAVKLDGYTISRTSRSWASIKPECRAEAIKAFQEMGYGERVVTLNASALSSLVNEWNEQGTLPEALVGMVSIYEKQGLSLRRSAK